MARTRGGGVIRGASAQPRRYVGNPRVPATRGANYSAPARPPPVMMGSAEVVAAAIQQPSVAAQHARNALMLSAISEAGDHESQPPEAGGYTFPVQVGDSLVTGTHVMEGGALAMGVPGASAGESAGDVNDALGPDLAFVFDGELGDGGIDIHDSVQNTFIENSIAEEVIDRPRIETKQDAFSGRFQRVATSRRKSPLSPPKVVWRMLYVDPDSDDPKRDARTLENAASEALRCACVFDVATDIVEALADVHDGTMWVYRGLFINESLVRHDRLCDKSVEGKHLARFLRMVGMRTRMVLLVAGDTYFDTTDASAHGLSAVLRKPFTKTGFCDVLRGMYLGSEPATDFGEPIADAEAAPPSVPRPVQAASFRGQHHCRTKRPRESEGAPLAAVAAAAAATARCSGSGAAALGGSGVVHVGHPPTLTPSPSYPACLGFTPFTPFTHPMIGAYPLGSGFLRSGQRPKAGPQRKYTKIAPRELSGGVDLLAPPVEGNNRAGGVAAETSAIAVAADVAGENAILPCSSGVGGLGMAKGEVAGDTNIAPPGGDDCVSGVHNVSLSSASSVDDVLPDEPASARCSTQAAAAAETAKLKCATKAEKEATSNLNGSRG